ncbi:hypothetical protein ACW9HM_05125 [Nocardia gipuzkoensis]
MEWMLYGVRSRQRARKARERKLQARDVLDFAVAAEEEAKKRLAEVEAVMKRRLELYGELTVEDRVDLYMAQSAYRAAQSSTGKAGAGLL